MSKESNSIPDDLVQFDEDTNSIPDDLVQFDEDSPASTSVIKSIDSGVGSIPGVRQVGAAVNTAIDLAKHPSANIVDTYNAWRQQQNSQAAKAEKDHPVAYTASSLLANLAAAVGAGPALAASKPIGVAAEYTTPLLEKIAGAAGGANTAKNLEIAKQGLTNLGLGGAMALESGSDSPLFDTAVSALGGEAAGKVAHALAHGVVKGAGKAIAGAHNAMDDALGWFGKSKIAQSISSKNPGLGEISSQRVKDLRSAVNAADEDFGPAAAKIMLDAESALGSTARTRLDQLSDKEKALVADYFASLIKERGASGVTPSRIVSNWDNIVNRYVGSGGEGTPMDLLKGVNKRDAKWYASTGAGIEDTNRVLGLSDEVANEVKDMFSGAKRTRDLAAEGKINRFGQFKETSEDPGKYVVDIGQIPESEKAAFKLGKAAKEGRAVIDSYDNFSASPKDMDLASLHDDAAKEALERFYGKNYPEGDTPASVAKERIFRSKTGEEAADKLDTYKAMGERTESNMRGEVSNLLERARYWRDHLKSIEEAKIAAQGNAMEIARLNKEASIAQKELNAIAVGRSAIENAAGFTGAALGGTRGLMSAAVGAAMGKPVAKATFKGIDALGELGQKLVRTASFVEALSNRDDHVGRMAKWALSAEGDNAIARMKILSQDPDVSREIEDLQR